LPHCGEKVGGTRGRRGVAAGLNNAAVGATKMASVTMPPLSFAPKLKTTENSSPKAPGSRLQSAPFPLPGTPSSLLGFLPLLEGLPN